MNNPNTPETVNDAVPAEVVAKPKRRTKAQIEADTAAAAASGAAPAVKAKRKPKADAGVAAMWRLRGASPGEKAARQACRQDREAARRRTCRAGPEAAAKPARAKKIAARCRRRPPWFRPRPCPSAAQAVEAQAAPVNAEAGERAERGPRGPRGPRQMREIRAAREALMPRPEPVVAAEGEAAPAEEGAAPKDGKPRHERGPRPMVSSATARTVKTARTASRNGGQPRRRRQA
jgi:23S rRNA pseudouridine2605 synthase